jgi:hypothetical protein
MGTKDRRKRIASMLRFINLENKKGVQRTPHI